MRLREAGWVGVSPTLGIMRNTAAALSRWKPMSRAVRQANPEAWVVYKPHPDVVAGLRQAGAQEAQALQWCNEIVLQAPMSQMLHEVDEVHVMTSLTGFEALLRGLKVVCYGQPFYAGWGLTQDRHPHPRRTRALSLNEMVAASLLLYPVYVSRSNGQVCSPEQALQELLAWRQQSALDGTGWRGWWRHGWQRCLRPFSLISPWRPTPGGGGWRCWRCSAHAGG